MADKKVGEISHYYNHLGVAIIEVKSSFSIGDILKFVRQGQNEEIFQQKVESIQVDHQQVNEAKKGMSIGLKVDKPVHEGNLVFKI